MPTSLEKFQQSNRDFEAKYPELTTRLKGVRTVPPIRHNDNRVQRPDFCPVCAVVWCSIFLTSGIWGAVLIYCTFRLLTGLLR